MKRLAIALILTVSLALALGCRLAPSTGQQPDDIVPTPGGITYRANVYEQGKTNPWPPIQSNTVVLGDNVTITYRAYIETKAGESRNNIIFMRIPDRYDFDTRNLNLSASNIPAGISVKEGEGGGGLPGVMAKVLVIEISQDVGPGEYTLEINMKFEGKDYGQIPCTVKVVQD